jgi:hypothetical protein
MSRLRDVVLKPGRERRSNGKGGGMPMEQPRPCLAAWTLLALMMALPSQAQTASATPPEDATEAAGESGAQTPASEPAAATSDDEESDTEIDEAEPDFTVVNLPTALAVPRFKSAFRVTHRFARPLGAGSFGDLADDLFGFDNGAQIGLEYRFGVTRDAQIGIYRTSDKTIQFFGQYLARRPTETLPVAVAVLLSAEGLDNFRDEYSPSVGAVVSYRFGSRGAVYAQPMWVGNTNLPIEIVDADDSTFLLGLSGRVSVVETVYLVLEFAPRVAGYREGDEHVSFAIEKQVGGHVFQLNFSNGIGSTRRQLVRDATEDWFIGFNISRKLW